MVDIIKIWTDAFGDAPAFPRRLLADCGLYKNALVAECDGKAVSCLLLYPGLKLGDRSAAYLYALCTHPEYTGRGIATALTVFAAEKARNMGCDLLVLQPGDKPLEQWYARQGFSILWRCSGKLLDISALSAPPAEEIGPDEFLSALPDGFPATRELIFSQDAVNRLYGGAFLRAGKDVLCVEECSSSLLIRAANCQGDGLLRAAASAAARFGVKEIFLLRRDDENGPNALMGLPLSGELSGFPQELFFPFTLN